MLKDLSIVDALGRFRLIALIEGMSFLLLLFVAMPLKYVWGNPTMVKIVGQAHGLLFVAFVLAGILVAIGRRWSIALIVGAFVSSLIPFGTFYLDVWLRKNEHRYPAPQA